MELLPRICSHGFKTIRLTPRPLVKIGFSSIVYITCWLFPCISRDGRSKSHSPVFTFEFQSLFTAFSVWVIHSIRKVGTLWNQTGASKWIGRYCRATLILQLPSLTPGLEIVGHFNKDGTWISVHEQTRKKWVKQATGHNGSHESRRAKTN